MASDRARTLLADVLKLPDDERRYIADCINQALAPVVGVDGWAIDADVSDEWKEEIERRCAEIDAGSAEWADADEAHRDFAAAAREHEARQIR